MVRIIKKILLAIFIFYIIFTIFNIWDYRIGWSTCRMVNNKKEFYKILNKLESGYNNLELAGRLRIYTFKCHELNLTKEDIYRVKKVFHKIEKIKNRGQRIEE